jgi:hypothetical protein
MSRADHWDDVYGARSDTAVSWYDPGAAESLALFDALGITSAAAVVDVGAGASRLVDALLDRGFDDLTVLDISEQALTVARDRLGTKADDVEWLVSDLLAWRPEREYDVWHDRAVLHFLVDPDERSRYRVTLEAAIVVGGHVIVGAFAPDGPEQCSGLPVVRYDDRGLGETLGPDFELVHTRRHEHRTPSGAVQPFTWAGFVRTTDSSGAHRHSERD